MWYVRLKAQKHWFFLMVAAWLAILPGCSLQTSVTDLEDKSLHITIEPSGSGLADGSSAVTLTITMKVLGVGIPGVTPTYAVTGSNNIIGACTVSDSQGRSTCLLKSSTAETKYVTTIIPAKSKPPTKIVFNPATAPRAGFAITSAGGVMTGGASYLMRASLGEPYTPNILKRPNTIKEAVTGLHGVIDP